MSPLLFELALAPLLMLQGRRVRRITPLLPEAAGPREGVAGRGGPALRVLIAGDSSAAGVGVRCLQDAMAGLFPALLAARLNRAVSWRLVARTGLTASGLLATLRAEWSADAPAFDVAVIVVGVNDVTARRSVGGWLSDLQALRGLLAGAAPAARIVWSGLPPMHRFPVLPDPLRTYLGARARRLDTALARWVAADPAMCHLPIPDLEGEGLMASDGFHPGPQGHRLWGGLLAQAVAQIPGIVTPRPAVVGEPA